MDTDKRTYVGNIHTLHASDGELYIDYGDGNRLVMCVNQLYGDLPSIIDLVCKEQKKMQEMYLEQIKDSIESL
tara:strand:- start:1038 stop:1256 length:219 start_codon:yes stop_codon:yes gene_type:complete